MGEGVSELVARILENLGSSAFQEINWISGVKDELHRIKETLFAIDAVLLDAQEQQSASKSMKQWLQNLKLVAYDIEDVLDLISTQELELKVNGRSLFRTISRLFMNYDVAQELKAIRHRLDEIEYRRRNFNFQEQRTVPLLVQTTVQRETYSYVCGSDVIGREEDKWRIISCLLSHDVEQLSVIPIIGIGGMGKTTLAKLVFNDPTVVSSFDLRLWVYVSRKFVLRSLIASMLQTATGLNFSHLNMELLHTKLCEKLAGQTYLLILDDVWIKDPKDWMELKDLLSVGSPRSKIIVTTREERVASVTGTIEAYKLKSLSDDHCWSIFAKYAFKNGEEETYPLLVEIGKSMVQKCCGVALAAKTLGGMLQNERDDHTWKRIEESELWKIEQGPKDILPALKLSYDQTPYPLRSCFAFCAMFRKGYPLFRIDLITMWMALGLLQPRGGEDVETIGDKYFSELLSRSFLQFPGFDVAKKAITKYAKVFDEKSLWNDIAYMFQKNLIENTDFISQAFFEPDEKLVFVEMHDLMHDLAAFVSEETTIVTSCNEEISPSGNHIVWDHEDLSRKGFPVHLLKPSKARAFTFVHPMGSVSESFLRGLMSNFKCLRILNLNYSDFDELPDSVGDLKHLRYLNLSWNLKLVVLPQSTCKLVNLQTLDLFRCPQLAMLPKGIHKLVSLRCLTLTSKLVCFPKGGLYGLSSLRVLKLWYCQHLASLPEGIESLKKLRILQIIGCDRIAFLPNEMKYLSSIEELKFFYCRRLNLKGWEGLYGLKSLKFLDFRELPKLEDFPDGLHSAAGTLQYLRIAWCENLRALPDGLQHCTSLLRLTLSNCHNMTALPRYMHGVKSLRELNIDGCPEIIRRCQKDVGVDWHLISHIPQIRIDHQLIQK